MLRFILVFLTLCLSLSAHADTELRRIGTWNMKWLGTAHANKLDPVENVGIYADLVVSTGATLFALQEICATHSVRGFARCHYLDLITQALSDKQGVDWYYYLDDRNKPQRLAYLYRSDQWQVENVRSVWPGRSYRSASRPLVGTVTALGTESDMSFDIVNVHFKAFPDVKSRGKRQKNIIELAQWLSEQPLDEDIMILGDTNIYPADGYIEKPLADAGFSPLVDSEDTAIHDDKLSHRFDRFYISDGMKDELANAMYIVGKNALIDVVKNDSQDYLLWHDKQVSDHFPVILTIAIQ